MNNAAFHNRHDYIKATQDSGRVLEFLPVHSLDLNPIEHKWAQAKVLRRKQQCCIQALFDNSLDYINL